MGRETRISRPSPRPRLTVDHLAFLSYSIQPWNRDSLNPVIMTKKTSPRPHHTTGCKTRLLRHGYMPSPIKVASLSPSSSPPKRQDLAHAERRSLVGHHPHQLPYRSNHTGSQKKCKHKPAGAGGETGKSATRLRTIYPARS